MTEITFTTEHHLVLTSVAALLFTFLLLYLAYKTFDFYFEVLDNKIPRTWKGNILCLLCLLFIALILALFTHYYWHFVHLYQSHL